MKRITMAILLACCTLVLAAQDAIKVNYQGARPTINDFASAVLLSGTVDDSDCDESTNAVAAAWTKFLNGEAQEKGVTLTVDQKNGFIVYESKYEDYLSRVEMCYWNDEDKEHKLFAYNVSTFFKGKYEPGQFDGLTFYRYNNATKKMTLDNGAAGFDVEYMKDGSYVSYALPRSGKDITATIWHDKGKVQEVIKWNGSGFDWE